MSDKGRWFHDEILELSDEELADLMYIKDDTTHQGQLCPIGVLDSLRGITLKLVLFSVMKRFLVLLHAKGRIQI